MKKISTVLLTFFIITIFSGESYSKVFMKRDEALKTAFPEADTIEKKQIFLSDENVAEVEALSESKLESKLYIIYKALNGGNVTGYAIIDTHLLRTKTETVMYVINTDGALRQAEILAFFEPTDYMARDNWIELYKGKSAGEHIRIGKDLPNITGATITANSFAQSVRRVLAVYHVAQDTGQLE